MCKQWQKVARHWWKSAKILKFDGVFVTFKGKYSGSSIFVIYLVILFYCFEALTDSILNSLLARGCHELELVDVSASPRCLSEHSLYLIGKHVHFHSHLLSCKVRHVLQETSVPEHFSCFCYSKFFKDPDPTV